MNTVVSVDLAQIMPWLYRQSKLMCDCPSHTVDRCRRRRQKRWWEQLDSASGGSEKPPAKRPRPDSAAPKPDLPPPVLQQPVDRVQPALPEPPPTETTPSFEDLEDSQSSQRPHYSDPGSQSCLSLQQHRADQEKSVCVQSSTAALILQSC
ncbi:hypothetical protein OJAV_G00137100 [Oryzias javanicus]|uniref:Uncharacterized protein n=1 Tax=Oryzias javanicus TaxID=123683 RepID=A0A437CLS2_ORYJA|nr:hypothetical protein OJAV_G00137100 [Oryzias javanicus]